MGKAPLLDAAAPNGVNSSTFSVVAWWLLMAGGGRGLVLQRKRRAISGGAGGRSRRQNCCIEVDQEMRTHGNDHRLISKHSTSTRR